MLTQINDATERTITEYERMNPKPMANPFLIAYSINTDSSVGGDSQ